MIDEAGGTPDEEMLRRFLLGELPLDEAREVELRVLRDDDWFDLAEAVEWELLEACAAGELGPAERQRVLERLASSPEGKERLARAGAVRAVLTPPAVEPEGEPSSWELCVRLCDASVATSRRDSDEAIEQAELALATAERCPGSEAWRSRLKAYALAHLANARRVQGDLSVCEVGFAKARELWRAGSDPEQRLSEAQMLALEATLRREKNDPKSAFELLDRALLLARESEKPRLLISKALALETFNQPEEAIEVLLAAERLIDESDPVLLGSAIFNLLVNLCHVGRHREAEVELPRLRHLLCGRGNELDDLRVLWLESRVHAGLGRLQQAEGLLHRVRVGFLARGMTLDAALATLETAVLLLEEGRHGEVKSLAREAGPAFRAHGLSDGALASLQVFLRAAEQEAVTLDMARRLSADLRKASQKK